MIVKSTWEKKYSKEKDWGNKAVSQVFKFKGQPPHVPPVADCITKML